MRIVRRLRKLITGLTVPQEYCCLGFENFQHPLSVFLTSGRVDCQMDVTTTHVFLGYKPLIIAIPFSVDDRSYEMLKDQPHICLSFGGSNFERNVQWHSFPSDKNSLAKIHLRKTDLKTVSGRVILFYEGQYGQHSFLDAVHQFVNRQRRKLLKDAPNNVALPGNLVDQVRIAYSVPRLVSIVTTSNGSLINMFPTDLHGTCGDDLYVSSLRIGGLATQQVEDNRSIVISDVDLSSYKESYNLGKNHMSTLRDEGLFSISSQRSETFNYPLPAKVLRYRELNQLTSFDHGIHRIHLYEIVNKKSIRENGQTLAHIHQYYAQWRTNHGLPTHLFYR
jgi:hypothetical protein